MTPDTMTPDALEAVRLTWNMADVIVDPPEDGAGVDQSWRGATFAADSDVILIGADDGIWREIGPDGVVTFAGKPCGGSFIAAGLTCRIGGARAFTDGEDFKDYFAGHGATPAAPPKSRATAIEGYGNQAYKTVNAGLRGNGKLSAADKKVIAEMDAYMETAKPLDEDVMVFRGGSLPPGLKAGGEFTDAGFGSTSGDIDIARNFVYGNSVLMQVRLPKGAKVLPFGAAMKGNDFESEVVVPRGSRYRVTGTSKMKRKILTYLPSGKVGTKTITLPVVELELVP